MQGKEFLLAIRNDRNDDDDDDDDDDDSRSVFSIRSVPAQH